MNNVTPYGVSKTEPWSHQVDGYHYAMSKVGCGLWYDMGCGKSKCAIDVIRNWGGARHTLIVCPKCVIPVWPVQFDLHCAPPLPRILILNKGTARDKAALLQREITEADRVGQKLVVVVNYESVWRKELGALILSLRWNLVVGDEIHRAKSYSSTVSKFLGKLALLVEKRIGLSGTPLPHSPLDAFGVYRFVSPSLFGRYWSHFRAKYAIMHGPKREWVKGFNPDLKGEIAELMATCSKWVRSEDVLDLPEMQDIWLWHDLPPKTAKIYKSMEKDLLAEIDTGVVTAANTLVKQLRLQQITGGNLKTDDGVMEALDECKAEQVLDVLENLPPGEPVVVFAQFTEDLKRIAARVKTAERPYFELSGHANDLQTWKDTGAAQGGVLGVQIQAGSEGIDLTLARYCIYYSTGFRLGIYQQSRKRLHRPGQCRKVVYYHLGAKATVDEDISKGLAAKADLVQAVLEGMRARAGRFG